MASENEIKYKKTKLIRVIMEKFGCIISRRQINVMGIFITVINLRRTKIIVSR